MKTNLADLAPAPSTVTVTDRNRNTHEVLAARRIDHFRVLVIRNWHSQYTPFVVHVFNEQDGGFHHGHYCETLERANEVFDQRAKELIA